MTKGRGMRDRVEAAIMKSNRQASTPETRAEATYKVLSDFANSDRHSGVLLGEALVNDHNLLQAYNVGLMLDMIKAMASIESPGAENEAAVKLCKEIMDAIGEHPQYL